MLRAAGTAIVDLAGIVKTACGIHMMSHFIPAVDGQHNSRGARVFPVEECRQEQEKLSANSAPLVVPVHNHLAQFQQWLPDIGWSLSVDLEVTDDFSTEFDYDIVAV